MGFSGVAGRRLRLWPLFEMVLLMGFGSVVGGPSQDVFPLRRSAFAGEVQQSAYLLHDGSDWD